MKVQFPLAGLGALSRVSYTAPVVITAKTAPMNAEARTILPMTESKPYSFSDLFIAVDWRRLTYPIRVPEGYPR